MAFVASSLRLSSNKNISALIPVSLRARLRAEYFRSLAHTLCRSLAAERSGMIPSWQNLLWRPLQRYHNLQMQGSRTFGQVPSVFEVH